MQQISRVIESEICRGSLRPTRACIRSTAFRPGSSVRRRVATHIMLCVPEFTRIFAPEARRSSNLRTVLECIHVNSHTYRRPLGRQNRQPLIIGTVGFGDYPNTSFWLANSPQDLFAIFNNPVAERSIGSCLTICHRPFCDEDGTLL